MALPIRETPILRGEDARRFIENADKAKDNPVLKEEDDRARAVFDEMCRKGKQW